MSTSTPASTFPVEVTVYTEPTRRREYPLPHMDAIERLQRQAAEERQAADRSEGDARALLTARADALRDEATRLLERRAKFVGRPETEERRYLLRPPTYLAYSEAEERATTIERSEVKRNMERLRRDLLLQHLAGVQVKDANGVWGPTQDVKAAELSPNIAFLLGDEVLAACFPSSEDLDFLP